MLYPVVHVGSVQNYAHYHKEKYGKKLEEIKEQVKKAKADFYPRDRKGWFEAFEVREQSWKTKTITINKRELF